MRLAFVAEVAGFAALSQAFLLPPTLTAADKDIVETLPFEHAAEVDSRIFVIGCPGCPVALPDASGTLHNVANLDSKLRLNFSVAHGDGVDRLLLNGAQLYPKNLLKAPFFEPITAPQMIESIPHPNTWIDASNPQLGYRLHINHVPSSNEEIDLVELEFQVVEVGDRFIRGMHQIDLKILETPSGKLMIGDGQIVVAPSEEVEAVQDGEECTSIICKWKATIAHKLQGTKGCGRKSGKHSGISSGFRRPHIITNGGYSSHKDYAHRKSGHHDHHHHRHHRHHHPLIRFIVGIALHVLVPIAIGMVVGITASVLGVLAGNFVIFVWRVLFRRNTPRVYAQVPQEDATVGETEKIKIIIGDEQQEEKAPPVYEEVVEPKA